MSVAANKAMVRCWFGEMVNGRTARATLLAALEETFAPQFVDHDEHDPVHGRAALQQALPGLLAACPDAHFTIEHVVAAVGQMVETVQRQECLYD